MVKFLVCTMVGLILVTLVSAQKKPAKPSPSTSRGPYTLSEILDGITAQRDNAQIDLESLIRKRGVTFQATPELIKVLRDYGASDTLVSLLPKLPVTPVTKPSAALRVLCRPVDCEVIVNKIDYGLTANGSKEITGLEVGDASVNVLRDGYERSTQNLTLRAGESAERTFVLQPGEAQRRLAGQRALGLTLRALGGMQGIEEIENLIAKGGLELKAEEQASNAFKFVVAPAARGRTLRLQSDSGAYCTVPLLGNAPSECKGRKAPPAAETFLAVDLLVESSMLGVISHFVGQDVALTETADGAVLETKGAGETFSLTLDKQSLPLEFAHRTVPASAPVERIEYANYSAYKKLHYPRQITVTNTVPKSVVGKFSIDLVTDPSTGKETKNFPWSH